MSEGRRSPGWATRLFPAAILALGLATAIPGAGQNPPSPAPRGEAFRIGFTHAEGGPIEVSTDAGATWMKIGTIQRPATATGVSSPAAGVAPAGSVAGVAGNYILVRLPGPAGSIRSMRITSSDHPVSASTIVTDLPAGAPLFRELAPAPGSRCLLAGEEGGVPFPATYHPVPGERWIISVASQPEGSVSSLTIENKEGGSAIFQQPGGLPQLVGRVKRPLRGIGRYAGTENAGPGSLLSWTPLTVMIGTSARTTPAGADSRGGFVIQPAELPLVGATHRASQMLIENVQKKEPAPVAALFHLPFHLTPSGKPDETAGSVELRIDGGEWLRFPAMQGPVSEADFHAALQKALGLKEAPKMGVTHLRLLSPAVPAAVWRRRAQIASAAPVTELQRGVVNVSANVSPDEVKFVRFKLEGRQMLLTNISPFVWRWDTTGVPNGDYLIEIEGLDERLQVVSRVTARVRVAN